MNPVLKCPTCRHSWPLRTCEWCGALFDPNINYKGEDITTRAGQRRRFCSLEHKRASNYRTGIVRNVGKVA
jgi:hypothetical protein